MARKKAEAAEVAAENTATRAAAEEKTETEQTVDAEQAADAEQEAVLKGRVRGGSLNVRRCPKRESPIERVLTDGEEVEILETVKEWYRIRDGYIRAEYVAAK